MGLPPDSLLESMTLDGFLSFASGGSEIPLAPLNVLIGPNGSGKSNLVEAFAVLRAVPKDLPRPIHHGGRVKDWLWKGTAGNGAQSSDGRGAGLPAARLELVFGPGRIASFPPHDPAVRYRLVFGSTGDSFAVLDERVENVEPSPGRDKPYFYFAYENGRPMLNVRGEGQRELRREDIDPTQSILSQRRDPEAYPELTRLADILGKVRIYRSWYFGPDAPVRTACRADTRSDYLSEALDNLPARLSALRRDPAVKRRLIELVRDLASGFDDFEVVAEGGTLNLYLTEGNLSIPARRLSDGTLHYLCLLAILVDPEPPPLIVIEEPELGLHPDILPGLAALLREASARTQLVITTHSDSLVDALTDTPDAVIVCEKVDGGTQLRRLDAGKLKPWLEKYRLGELWTRGEIGGTRW
jgi:predicted ATPase